MPLINLPWSMSLFAQLDSLSFDPPPPQRTAAAAAPAPAPAAPAAPEEPAGPLPPAFSVWACVGAGVLRVCHV